MLNESCFMFALESLKKYVTVEPKNNFFFNPHLIYQNLLMVYFGVNGNIENSLKQILYIPDIPKDTVKEHYFSKGVKDFCYVKPPYTSTCRTYCRVFISEFIKLTAEANEFFSTSHGHYVTKVNFGKSEQTRNFINNAITAVTQRCIRNLLPPESIHKNTQVVLLNAIYCKGEFDVFDDSKNTTVSSDNSNDDTELLGSYVVEVPCHGEEISTFFFFPMEYDSNTSASESIVQFLERLTTEEGSRKLRILLDYGTEKDLKLISPKFKIQQDLRMYELLDVLGVRELTPLYAPHAQPPQPVQLHEFTCERMKLGDSVHRISIDMSNDHITAAACNAFFTSNTCEHVQLTDTVDLGFNHPCVCLIYNRYNQHILFCGVLLEDDKTEGSALSSSSNDDEA